MLQIGVVWGLRNAVLVDHNYLRKNISFAEKKIALAIRVRVADLDLQSLACRERIGESAASRGGRPR